MVTGGALVNSVAKGSPADKAGIMAGDTIVMFDSKPVNTRRDILRLLGFEISDPCMLKHRHVKKTT